MKACRAVRRSRRFPFVDTLVSLGEAKPTPNNFLPAQFQSSGLWLCGRIAGRLKRAQL